jgi:hypothetical protein
MSIPINSYQGHYSTNGCNFYAAQNELLVVAEYWEESEKAADKQPLQGFGRAGFYKYLDFARQAILEEIMEKYGESVAATGVEKLGIPVLVIKFTLS